MDVTPIIGCRAHYGSAVRRLLTICLPRLDWFAGLECWNWALVPAL